MRFITIIAAMLFAAGALPAAEPEKTTTAKSPTTQPQKESFDKYNVLSERNMFMRERQRPRERSETPRTPRVETPPPTPEQTLVLRGIVLEEGELRAYFEDSATGLAKRVAPGDPIASGRVMDIVIDALQFVRDGQPIWIEIGHNLTGAVASRGSTSVATTSSTTSPTTGPAAGGTATDPKVLSKEEEMKARRRKQ